MKSFQFTKTHWAVDRAESVDENLATEWCKTKEEAIEMAKRFPKGKGPTLLVRRTVVTMIEPQPIEL